MIQYTLYSVLVNKNIGDCSNHGLSSRVDSGWGFHDCTREEAIEFCNTKGWNPAECFIIVERNLWGEDHSYAEPLIKPEGVAQTFGGNFLYTSDSRSYKFKGNSCSTPIPVHDRFEGWAQFDAMCK